MGEMLGKDNFAQGEKLSGDHAVKTSNQQSTNAPDGKFATDVKNCFADGEKHGVPVFSVSPKEFYNNMKQDRRRLRFKSGSPIQTYHSQSKYRRPFFVRNKDDGYTYKVK
jgi:hypothetical protein